MNHQLVVVVGGGGSPQVRRGLRGELDPGERLRERSEARAEPRPLELQRGAVDAVPLRCG